MVPLFVLLRITMPIRQTRTLISFAKSSAYYWVPILIITKGVTAIMLISMTRKKPYLYIFWTQFIHSSVVLRLSTSVLNKYHLSHWPIYDFFATLFSSMSAGLSRWDQNWFYYSRQTVFNPLTKTSKPPCTRTLMYLVWFDWPMTLP